jgi:hypothetical protein
MLQSVLRLTVPRLTAQLQKLALMLETQQVPLLCLALPRELEGHVEKFLLLALMLEQRQAEVSQESLLLPVL